MPNRIFRQKENTVGPFFRYAFLAIYVVLGGLVLRVELLNPAHDLFSILRSLSLYVMLISCHLASCFVFGPRLQIIVRVIAILSFVATFAVLFDDFRRLSDSAAQ